MESTVAAETAHAQSVRRELSAARLEGAPVAPGTMSTLRVFTDPEDQPPLPRAPLSPEVAEAQPVEAFELDSIEFLTCIRRARRGAAAGPSGMTSETTSFLSWRTKVTPNCCAGSPVCCYWGRSQRPFRGIVVGDVLRRLVRQSRM